MAEGETTARPHLRLETGRNLDGQPGRNESPVAGVQMNRRVDVGHEIHSGGVIRPVGGQWQFFVLLPNAAPGV